MSYFSKITVAASQNKALPEIVTSGSSVNYNLKVKSWITNSGFLLKHIEQNKKIFSFIFLYVWNATKQNSRNMSLGFPGVVHYHPEIETISWK